MKDLELTYRLLRKFKEGKIQGRSLSNDELQLVQVLLADLLPNTEFDAENFGELIYALASEDTKWNRLLADTLDKFYCEVERGKTEIGVQVLKTFMDGCPSHWYRSLAEIELKNLRIEKGPE